MKPLKFASFASLAGLHLTPAQAAHDAVVYDGADPCDLEPEARALAATMFGPVERVPPSARAVSVQVKGRDVGGSRRGALRLLQLALTLPLDRLDPAEIAFCLIGAPKLRLARVALRFARAAAGRIPGVRVVAEWRDGFTVERHDGRNVTLECFAASRAGDTGRSVPLIGVMLDESAFYRDESTGVVNDRHIFNALVPRLLPGGQILIVSSPWVEGGLLHDEFRANHGSPRTALASHCPTLVMRDDAETKATVERERERDPENALREFDAVFLSAGAGVLFGGAVDSSVDASLSLPLPADRYVRRAAGGDFGFVGDSSALVVVQEQEARGRLRYVVADILELRPAPGHPLVPSEVCAAFARVLRHHELGGVISDLHYSESVREHLGKRRVRLHAAPGGAEGKVATYSATRDALREGRVALPNHPRLLAQLKSVISKPTPGGGLAISFPRHRGLAHGDLVSALVLAVWALEQGRRAPLTYQVQARHLPLA